MPHVKEIKAPVSEYNGLALILVPPENSAKLLVINNYFIFFHSYERSQLFGVGKSVTSGKAGGLNCEPLKAVIKP